MWSFSDFCLRWRLYGRDSPLAVARFGEPPFEDPSRRWSLSFHSTLKKDADS
jgi:hypothetical protein